MFTGEDRKILRALARRVHELAEDPANDAKRALWRRHNAMKGSIPVVFVHPDGAWDELLPPSALLCEDGWARHIEYALRQRIVRAEIIRDDVPIEKDLPVQRSVLTINEGWGLVPEKAYSASKRGAWRFEPVVKRPADWKKLRKPVLEVDEKGVLGRLNEARDLLGGVLDVHLTGIKSFSFHMMHLYCDLRGLGEMMLDLVLEPGMVRDVISFIAEGWREYVAQCVAAKLVSLNNDGTFHYTGGAGYTDELPKEGFDGKNARLCDVWAAAEAQEFAQVSPEMHEEFILRYERELLEPFGLNGYGCCDDLTMKLGGVLKIKNLRRVSICPWADVEACAAVLKKDYIMSWKPQPSYLAMESFDEGMVEEYLVRELTKARQGYPEIVLRDTHTCRGEPRRFTEFVRLARTAIEKVYEREWTGRSERAERMLK